MDFKIVCYDIGSVFQYPLLLKINLSNLLAKTKI